MTAVNNTLAGRDTKLPRTFNAFVLFKRLRDYLNGYADYRQYPSIRFVETWPQNSHKHQLLTTYVATNLYWFGRHLQRIESTMIDVLELFNKVIDTDKEAGVRYFGHLGIDLEYKNASDFLQQAIFGDHAANLAAIMSSARENAIICRPYIDAEAFGETIRLFHLLETQAKTEAKVDYRFIGDALSLINEIWGIMSRGLLRRKSDQFIRLGKLIEKVDLHLRHGRDGRESVIYLHNILITAQRIAPEAEMPIDEKDDEANLDAINNLINNLIID